MIKRPFAVAAAAVAVLAGAGSAPAGAQAHPPSPTSIAVDDDTPTPGQAITVTMSACRSRTFALFGLDLLLLGAARADDERVASTTVTIPRSIESGPHAVSGLCLGPDRRPLFVRTDITVADDHQAPPPTTTTTAVPPTTTATATTTTTVPPTTTAPPTTTTTTTTTTTVPPTTIPPTTVPPTTVPTTTVPTTEPGAVVVPPPTDRGSGPGGSRSRTTGGHRPGGAAPSPDALAEPVYPVDASAMFEDAAAANGVPAVPTPAAASRAPAAQDGTENTGAPTIPDSDDSDLGAMPTLARVALGLAAIGGVPVALAFSRGPRAAPRRRRLPFLGERYA